METILIVEDEERMASSLKRGLERAGYKTVLINDGLDARLFNIDNVDLVILDWGLPKFDGISVLNHWRKVQNKKTPILMFTARGDVQDKVTGLDFGADDYMSKFFEWEELYARIRALLRRNNKSTSDTYLGIKLVAEENAFYEKDKRIDLTVKEYALLEYFFKHPNEIVTNEKLIYNLYNLDNEPDSNVIQRHITSLRKKFKNDPIQTIRGSGYRLRLK